MQCDDVIAGGGSYSGGGGDGNGVCELHSSPQLHVGGGINNNNNNNFISIALFHVKHAQLR